jgi:hypothetical protein
VIDYSWDGEGVTKVLFAILLKRSQITEDRHDQEAAVW